MAGKRNVVEILIEAKKAGLDAFSETQKGISGIGTAVKGLVALEAVQVAGAMLRGIGQAAQFAAGQIMSAAEAASVQEQADRGLKLALDAAGQSSSAFYDQLKSQATQIQATTKYGDEYVQTLQALALNTGANADQAQRMTEAAINAADALGRDAQSMMINLSKTLAGTTGELGEMIPMLRDLSAEELKNGAAIDMLLERYGGMSEKLLDNAGRAQQVKNAWGDLQERMGASLVQSPRVAAALDAVVESIQEITDQTKGLELDKALVAGAAAAAKMSAGLARVVAWMFRMGAAGSEVTRVWMEIQSLSLADTDWLMNSAEGQRQMAKSLEEIAKGSDRLAAKLVLASEATRGLVNETSDAALTFDVMADVQRRIADADAAAAARAATRAEEVKKLADAERKRHEDDALAAQQANLQRQEAEAQALAELVSMEEEAQAQKWALLNQDLDNFAWVQKDKTDIYREEAEKRMDAESRLAAHVGDVGAELLQIALSDSERKWEAVQDVLAREAAAQVAAQVLKMVPWPYNLVAAPIAAASAAALINSFHTGGAVPNMASSDQIARVQTGEVIVRREVVDQMGGPAAADAMLNRGGRGGGSVVFQIQTLDPTTFESELRHGELGRTWRRVMEAA